MDTGMTMNHDSNELLLETEKAAPQSSPTWADVEAVVSSLGPRSNGYATLSHPARGYVQVAGARLRLTVEFREQLPTGDFRHYVLGRESDQSKDASVNTAAGMIKLKSNEILTASAAVDVFRSFFDTQTVPAQYTRRETTQMFKE